MRKNFIYSERRIIMENNINNEAVELVEEAVEVIPAKNNVGKGIVGGIIGLGVIALGIFFGKKIIAKVKARKEAMAETEVKAEEQPTEPKKKSNKKDES
jgi:hypothetical protein